MMKENISAKAATVLRERFATIHTEYWNNDYPDPGYCDGEQWSLIVRYSDGNALSDTGSNAYPDNWNELLDFFGIEHEKVVKVDTENPAGNESQAGKIIYCSVSFDGSNCYYYTTEDASIEVGDPVIVPVGADNCELTGVVEEFETFSPENVPFPLSRTKKIIRKVDDDRGGPESPAQKDRH